MKTLTMMAWGVGIAPRSAMPGDLDASVAFLASKKK
jgi:hypothetical protein